MPPMALTVFFKFSFLYYFYFLLVRQKFLKTERVATRKKKNREKDQHKGTCLILPWNGYTANIEFAIEGVITCIQINSFNSGKLLYVQHIFAVNSPRLQNMKNIWCQMTDLLVAIFASCTKLTSISHWNIKELLPFCLRNFNT